ncbi:alpha/beta hydrolase [Alicyclobacillus sp. ALC3]|uniref:alpha/beta hydrolase n=1 Tax=Alicyclobacillus sp. ALC3 TaxID=2796143 RepID=UPI002378697B|nr:alpha/beta hydrolase [Alicyclobacillus sp. ALC3]WDL97514.1 alpha/beta hydrolase [Alicyclobacillus sp. ALC3]
MSLDPTMQMVLHQLNSLPQVPTERLTPDTFRNQPHPPEPPVDLALVRDLELPLTGRTLRARLYVPNEAGDACLPTIVYYHGGGFVYGDLELFNWVCSTLAKESTCAVISVEYRLAPEHKFPEPVEDAYDALAYIVAHADELGVDTKRIAVAGDSAGGNLAAVTCLIAKERGGPQIVYQLLLYPVTGVTEEDPSVIENGTGYFLTADLIRWFGEQYQRSDEDQHNPHFAPLESHDLAELPPAFVATSGYDPLRDCGLAYAEALRSAGVAVEYHNFEDLIHGFANFGAWVPRAKEALTECAHRVRDALVKPSGL